MFILTSSANYIMTKFIKVFIFICEKISISQATSQRLFTRKQTELRKKKQIPCHDTDVDGDEKTQTALAAAAAVDAAVDAAGAAVDVVTCER